MGLESEILRLKWHVGCYCSLLHTNTNFRLLCLNVIFRETSPGLNAVLAVAPAPKISSWHRAKFWVSDFRLLVWSSWSNGHWWAYWCQSSSSPVWDLSYRASAWSHFQWSSTNPSIKGFFFRKRTILTAPVPTLLLELIWICKWSPFLDGC